MRHGTIVVIHGIAAVLAIGGPLWALHPALGTVGIIVGLASAAEVHGHLRPFLDGVKKIASRVGPAAG